MRKGPFQKPGCGKQTGNAGQFAVEGMPQVIPFNMLCRMKMWPTVWDAIMRIVMNRGLSIPGLPSDLFGDAFDVGFDLAALVDRLGSLVNGRVRYFLR